VKRILKAIGFSVFLGLSACTVIEPATVEPAIEAGQPTTYSYTTPEDSGLITHSPFPNPDDVCVTLNSNSLIKPFETKAHFLIACPKHEKGAIGDREVQQKARVIGNTRHWVLMRVPSTLKNLY